VSLFYTSVKQDANNVKLRPKFSKIHKKTFRSTVAIFQTLGTIMADSIETGHSKEGNLCFDQTNKLSICFFFRDKPHLNWTLLNSKL